MCHGPGKRPRPAQSLCNTHWAARAAGTCHPWWHTRVESQHKVSLSMKVSTSPGTSHMSYIRSPSYIFALIRNSPIFLSAWGSLPLVIKTYKCLTSEKLQGVLIGGSQQLPRTPEVKNMFRYIRDSFRDVHTVHTNVVHTWGRLRIYLILLQLSFLLTSGISQLPSLLCVLFLLCPSCFSPGICQLSPDWLWVSQCTLGSDVS